MSNNINLKINKVYQEIKDRLERFIILYGGAGSGKSVYIAQHIILDCIQNNGVRWFCFRKVAKTLRHSVFAELKNVIDELNINDLFKINKTDMSFTCVNGSVIILLGLDDSEKIKSISRPDKLWLEEASEFTYDDFCQLDLRLRGKGKYIKQMLLSFNPISSTHWLKQYFFDSNPDNTYRIKTTYLDNNYIDEDYKKRLESYKITNPYYYDVYAKGEWGNLTGVVYINWSVISANDLPDTFDDTYFGLDFGFNNPTALTQIKVKDNIYYIREILYQSQLTNSDLINELKKLNINGRIYCDSAEPQRIKELCDAGFNATPADKSVKDGIDFCKSQILRITDDSLNLINELNFYRYKTDKNNKVTDEIVKVNDHAVDSFRYAIYTHNKDFFEIPIITMNGIKYPSQFSNNNIIINGIKSGSISDAIQNLRMRNRFKI